MLVLCCCDKIKGRHVHLRKKGPGEFGLAPPRVPMCACGHGHPAGSDGCSEPCRHCDCPEWREPASPGGPTLDPREATSKEE